MSFSQIVKVKAGTIVFVILICANVVSAQTETKSPESPAARSAAAQSESWSVFRGNAESTGVATSTLSEELEIIWEFAVPQGAFEGSAAIVADKNTPGQKTVYIADLDGKVFSLDLDTGEKRWEFASEIGFVTSPAVKDGRIYIGDQDGIFYSSMKKVTNSGVIRPIPRSMPVPIFATTTCWSVRRTRTCTRSTRAPARLFGNTNHKTKFAARQPWSGTARLWLVVTVTFT